MKPYKIYVAGPMTGYPNFNYSAFFQASCLLALQGFIPVNPATIGQRKGATYEFYIRLSLEMLMSSDAIAVLDGWESSNGASLEVDVANAMGMKIYPLEKWISDPEGARLEIDMSHLEVGR